MAEEPTAENVKAQAQAMAAAVHDMNDELTILCSTLSELLHDTPLNDPNLRLLLDAHGATIRLVQTAAGMLNYARGKGARPSAATFSRISEFLG